VPYIGNIPAEKYASYDVQHITTSATTSYVLDKNVANENEIRVVLNNIIQQPGASYAYTASANTLTLSVATTSNDTLYVVFTGKAVQTVTPPPSSVGLAQFNATGSPGTNTFLRGDNSWATPSDTSLTLNNNAANRVVAGTGTTNTMDAQANLLFDGTKLGVGTTGAGAASTGKVSVSSGSGGTMPESVTAANSYVALGNNEYGASAAGKVMIALGYTGGAARTNAPAYIGYEEVLNSGYTKGNLTFYTRDVTTDTAPTKTMEINTAGAVTKPLQPGFSATKSTSAQAVNAAYVDVNFNNEIWDNNADWNGSTTFTAPVTGKYMFSGAIRINDILAQGGSVFGRMGTSNRNYLFGTITDADDIANATIANYQFQATVIADMDANDTMTMAFFSNFATTIDNDAERTWLQGYLLG